LKRELEGISSSLQPSPQPPAPRKKIFNNNQNLLTNKNIKFKFEPCILHVACKTLEDAETFLEKGKLAGWKKSGSIGLKNGITLELNSTEKLEFPIIQNKKILVNDDFLKIVVDEANKKLEKSWGKIKELERMI
jgi:tRNA(Phe) wybutosine-synthesizing methylase Tyw3